jgi:hypothetical protein
LRIYQLLTTIAVQYAEHAQFELVFIVQFKQFKQPEHIKLQLKPQFQQHGILHAVFFSVALIAVKQHAWCTVQQFIFVGLDAFGKFIFALITAVGGAAIAITARRFSNWWFTAIEFTAIGLTAGRNATVRQHRVAKRFADGWSAQHSRLSAGRIWSRRQLYSG